MSEERVVYSIQQTYIIKPVSKSEKRILTCDERIDIPTIEPLSNVKTVVYSDKFSKIIPCIELAGRFLDDFKFVFETNEGVTVLPIEIDLGSSNPLDNPYLHFRYVLVLPRGATGVKSCKITQRATGKEVQHNLTFGIKPPPYNYDNALLDYISYAVKDNKNSINTIEEEIDSLSVKHTSPYFSPITFTKGAEVIEYINYTYLFFETEFSYPLSAEQTIHKPKIVLSDGSSNFVYTLSLDRPVNTVSIDLFTGMITVYDRDTGEIMQQLKLSPPYLGYKSLSFRDYDDIVDSVLRVNIRGANVK